MAEGHTATVEIDAPPERVYDLVADVTRMGEWSPVCYKCEWLGGSTSAEPGARFKGYNHQPPAKWTRECEIHEAEQGKVLAFSTYYNGHESTRWRYTFEPTDGGTKVTEAYEPLYEPWYVRLAGLFQRSRMERDAKENIETSLGNLKRVAEGEAKAGS